jgi:hypothetical protein
VNRGALSTMPTGCNDDIHARHAGAQRGAIYTAREKRRRRPSWGCRRVARRHLDDTHEARRRRPCWRAARRRAVQRHVHNTRKARRQRPYQGCWYAARRHVGTRQHTTHDPLVLGMHWSCSPLTPRVLYLLSVYV